MINDPRLYQGVADDLERFLTSTSVSDRHNAIYDIGDLNKALLRGAIRDASAGGCAIAAKNAGGAVPSDRWVASKLRPLAPDTVQRLFEGQIKRQLDMLRKLGRVPKKIVIAVDCHPVCRYDRKPGEELTRSRYKNGTKYFERYITVQCVSDAMRLDLGAFYLKMGDSVPEYTGRLMDFVESLKLDVHLVLLDREFFSTNTMNELARRDVGFMMPCRNTGGVVAALREFADKKRGGVSDAVIEGATGSVPYTMLIEKRRQSNKTDSPEDRYIGFATNRQDSKILTYAKRWGIESGYGKLEEAKVKTRISNQGARMMCFYYSLLAFNEWIILRMMLSRPTDRQSKMTMLTFKEMMEPLLVREPKPPSDK